MSYGQVWYEDRHGRPYNLVAGMRVYQSTDRAYMSSRSDQVTAKNTLYNERYSRPASHRHSLSTASAAYHGYAASMARVRFADDLQESKDRLWSPNTADDYAPKRTTRKHFKKPKPTIVPWPSSYQEVNTSDHRDSYHRKSALADERFTVIDAEPGKRAKKYVDDLYYGDEFSPRPRPRSSSRESYESRSSSRDSYSGDAYMARRPHSHAKPSWYYY